MIVCSIPTCSPVVPGPSWVHTLPSQSITSLPVAEEARTAAPGGTLGTSLHSNWEQYQMAGRKA